MPKPGQTETAAVAEPDLSGWSEEDRKWLEGLPTELRNAAKRHGRFLFKMVMACGTVGECLTLLINSRPPQKMMTALGVLNQMVDAIAKMGIVAKGLDMARFAECKQDIERAALLVQGSRHGSEARSPGGIILNG